MARKVYIVVYYDSEDTTIRAKAFDSHDDAIIQAAKYFDIESNELGDEDYRESDLGGWEDTEGNRVEIFDEVVR